MISETSCFNPSPAAFWAEYHHDIIASNSSDQGPWGGNRELIWKEKTPNTFSTRELLEFANNHDWKLVDSISFSADTLSTKSFASLKNDDYSHDILIDKILPTLKGSDNIVFIFNSSMLNVEPGNARETYENGFAVFNTIKSELRVYHFWGE